MKENKKLYNAMYAVIMVFLYPVFLGWLAVFGWTDVYAFVMYNLSIFVVAICFNVYVKPLFYDKK